MQEDGYNDIETDGPQEVESQETEPQPESEEISPESQIAELNDKYLRLYAEFENYRKRVAKDREELIKYANETILLDMLSSVDNLDTALKHAGDGTAADSLRQGVENTLRELHRTLEKFGLKLIEAEGKPFDPEFHHAVSQVFDPTIEDKTVVEEFRRGYMYKDKVLRATMVVVSRADDETVTENS